LGRELIRTISIWERDGLEPPLLNIFIASGEVR